jgi:Family of unknown function (DUF6807)
LLFENSRIVCSLFVLTILVTIGNSFGRSAHGEEVKRLILEVNAGHSDRENLIIEADLPPNYRETGPFHLKRLDNGLMVPVQKVPDEDLRIAWILGEPLSAGKTRRYELCAAAETDSRKIVTVRDDGKRLIVEISGKPVLAYNHATVQSPDPEHPYYARSGYLHPVYAPDGQVLTDDFNPDHAHQHGVMFAWRKGTFEGRATNPWHQAEETGRVEHLKVKSYDSGPVFGQFAIKLRQVDLTDTDGPKPILDELWNLRVGNFSQCFVFDIEMTQTCAGKSPYTVEKIHYGAMAVRGSRAWGGKKPPAYDFLTDLGKRRENGNQTRARWIDFTGAAGGKSAGMVVLCHPQNFRFPQPVRLHPKMPYFCYTPASLGKFEIRPDHPYVSRYRFVCHEGLLTQDQIERLWQDYAHPPKVRTVVESQPE